MNTDVVMILSLIHSAINQSIMHMENKQKTRGKRKGINNRRKRRREGKSGESKEERRGRR